MTLMSVRSTTSQKGLVAILVEDGGPAVVAVPVNPREGLLLSAGESARTPTSDRSSGPGLSNLGVRSTLLSSMLMPMPRCALVCCSLRAERRTRYRAPLQRHWLLRSCLERPIAASDKLLQLRGLALDAQELSLRFARWREELATMAADEAASST